MIQELQMTTVLEDNIHNFAVEGTSDDLDVPIKENFQVVPMSILMIFLLLGLEREGWGGGLLMPYPGFRRIN